jgi:hypothetical protein
VDRVLSCDRYGTLGDALKTAAMSRWQLSAVTGVSVTGTSIPPLTGTAEADEDPLLVVVEAVEDRYTGEPPAS